MKAILLLTTTLISMVLKSQEIPQDEGETHKFYVTWGYNRAYYNNSDIHFKGDDFDFTLYDVVATDIPEPFDAKVYLNPVKLTIPQFDFRIGYYINDKVAISGGWDHMKYKLFPNQVVLIDGFMKGEQYGEWEGEYNNEYIQVVPGLLQYEHSDGFNFVRIGVERYSNIWVHRSKPLKATSYVGASAGLMFPWTDFHFVGEYYRNWIHLSGWGVSVLAGARFEFLNYFFIQGQAQAGYTHMGDILLQNEANSRADQSITFIERSWSLGGIIPITTK